MAASEAQQLSTLEGIAVAGQPKSLYTLFYQAARDYPENIAVESLSQPDDLLSSSSSTTSAQSRNSGLCWTYAQLHDGANRLATALDAQGVGSGDTIALFLDNCAESALFLWTAARLKTRFAPLDSRSLGRPKEIDHYCDVLKPRVIVVKDVDSAEIFHSGLLNFSPNLVVIVACSDKVTLEGCHRLKDLLCDYCEQPPTTLPLSDLEEKRAESDIGLIIFTSGTTGLSKACGHSNKNLWYERNSMVHFRKVGPSQKSLHHLPISHVFGALNLVVFLTVGATIVMVSPRFDAQATLSRLRHQDIDKMSVVPSMVQALVDLLPSQGPVNTSPRLNISIGGTTVSPEVIRLCLDSSKVGANYANAGYGLSEGLPMLSSVVGDEISVHEGFASVGRIAPGGLAKICAPSTFEPVQRRALGELHLGGPMVINGYLKLDSEAFYKDEKGNNWFVTGDQARMDETGAVYILGRYKDLIIRAGENISPGAIEACLERIPGITNPQVIGTTDELAGEVPTAVLSLGGDCTTSPREMKEIVLAELGHSAVPKHILTLKDLGLSTLPMTTSGKTRKGDLKAIVQSHLMKSQESRAFSPEPQSLATEDNACLVVWSRLLSVSIRDIPLDTPLSLLADSLMVLQFTGIMNREFNIQMQTSPSEDATIRQLASSIPTQYDAAPRSRAIGRSSASIRRDAPRLEDMVHTLNLEDGLAQTVKAATPSLSSAGLHWDDDVEDVYPVPGAYPFITRVLRPKAWNIRLAFTIPKCSEEKLRNALKRSLCRWPLFRALYIRNEDYKEVPPLFCVIRSSSQGWLDKCIEPRCIDISEIEELRNVILPAPSSAQAPGPLFRAAICSVRDSKALGLVVQIHHSTFDATSVKAWRDELTELITAPDWDANVPQDLFKLYAEMYYLNCKGPLASAAVAFHVARVRGISTLEPTLWPKRRAARWFIGDDESWTPMPDVPGYTPLQRRPLNQDRTLGVNGIQRTIELPHLDRLKQHHGVGAAMLMKSACTLFNLYMTKQSTIIFGNIQASRAWPFIPGWMAAALPNAIDIPGPTFETLLDVTHIPTTDESVVSLMKRAEQDQAQISKWPHVPVSSVLDQLGDDKAVYAETRIRQAFNWLHTWRGADTSAQSDDDDEVLKVVQSERWFDMGVFWNCGLIDRRSVRLLALYDDCQVSHEEMSAATNLFLAIAGWISEPANWGRSIEECLAEQIVEETLRQGLEPSQGKQQRNDTTV